MKTFFKVIVASIVVLGGIYGLLLWQEGRETTSDDSIEQIRDFFIDITGKDKLSFLLFGVPGPQYNGGSLTDTIMAIRIDKEKKSVAIVSIPRDLWIWTEREQFKLNESLVRDNVEGAIDNIEEMTGFDVDGYIVISLSFVSDIIDSIGGVEVSLNEPVVDNVSGYMLSDGEHVLNGEDVIWLVRNRFHTQGDFFREKNQHAVLEGLLKKIRLLNGEQRENILRQFVFHRNDVQIHISLPLILSFLGEGMGEVLSYDIKSIVVDFSTKLFKTEDIPYDIGAYQTQTVSTIIPQKGIGEYEDIRVYIEKMLSQ